MKNKTHFELRCSQVVQDLRLGNGVEHQSRFRFDDHRSFNHQVSFVRTNRDSVVDQVVANQLLDRDAATLQFDRESFPVDGFEKAVPERVMDVKECLDYLSREVL